MPEGRGPSSRVVLKYRKIIISHRIRVAVVPLFGFSNGIFIYCVGFGAHRLLFA